MCEKEKHEVGFEPTLHRLSVLVVMRLRPLGHLDQLNTTSK